MPKEIKSLVAIAQDVLARHLDSLDDVGATPYYLLREALRRATPQQLERIERINPHLIPESNELWLPHCLSFTNIRDAYHNGEYRDPTMWRPLYRKRFQESEHKRQMIRNKVKKEYNKIQSEKAARSIKILKSGAVPAPNRRSASMFEAAKRSRTSKIFQDTRRAAERTQSIFKHKPPISRPSASRSTYVTTPAPSPRPSQPPQLVPHPHSSVLVQAYNSLKEKQGVPPPSPPPYRPLIQPPSSTAPAKAHSPSTSGNLRKDNPRYHVDGRPRLTTTTTPSPSVVDRSPTTTTKRPAAIVNFDFFKQLS